MSRLPDFSPSHEHPPWLARIVLYAAIRDEGVRDGLLGDLNQEFPRRDAPLFNRALMWFAYNAAALSLAVRFLFGAGSLKPTSREATIQHGGRLAWIRDLGQDVRFAARGLVKAKSFAIVAILSLALGLGVNTALYSVARAFLVPVPGINGAERVIEVLHSYRGRESQEWAYPDFADVRTSDLPIAQLAGSKQRQATIATENGGQTVQAVYASANYFRVLGVGMFLGRDFYPSEDVGPGSNPVAVLSYQMWQTDLGGDPGIVGQTIMLNRAPYTVIGIASKKFRGHQPLKMGPFQPDLWVPLTQHPFVAGSRPWVSDRKMRWLEVIGRLHAGATVDEANVALATVFSRLAEQHAETNEGRSARAAKLGPVPALGRAASMAAVAMLFVLAGIALLIICGNLAGMALARSAAREREIAVRLALGSGRGRLVWFLMVEAVVLALLGGTAGVLLAFWSTRASVLGFFGIVLPPNLDLTPNGAVLAISFALALSASLVFGLFPAIRFSQPDLVSSFNEKSGGGGRRVGRIHRIAASAQTGFALATLIVCALCVRALGVMEHRDFGFEPEGLLVARVDLSQDGNESLEEAEQFFARVRESVGSVPGVTSVTVADGTPLDLWGNYTRVSRADRENEEGGRVLVEFTRATEGFFETIGTPILRGRGFEPADDPSSELVAVITNSLAERLWPGEDAVGRQIRCSLFGDFGKTFTVVGIVNHTASSRPWEDLPHLFASLRQNYQPRILIAAKGSSNASSLIPSIRSAIMDADRSLPVPNVVTSESMIERSTIGQRLNAQAAAGFGLLALLLSAIGVYGVVAYSVTSRTSEIGLRMAIGATRKHVMTGVFLDGVRLAAPGLVVGALVAIGAAATTGGFLLGVSPADPLSLGAGATVLLAVILLASLVPARRASEVDPMEALRCD